MYIYESIIVNDIFHYQHQTQFHIYITYIYDIQLGQLQIPRFTLWMRVLVSAIPLTGALLAAVAGTGEARVRVDRDVKDDSVNHAYTADTV